MNKKNIELYKKIFIITFPIAIQQFISTAVSFVDNIMIGSLGDTSIAALGLANKVFFIYALLLFGLSTGAAIFISQFWGKKDTFNISKTASFMFLIALGFSLIFFIPAFFFSENTLRIFSPDLNVINAGKNYIKVIALTYPIVALTFVIETTLRSTEKTHIPMIASFFSLGINVFLNYIFIFGKFGAPELRETGAAIGTLIARIFQLSIELYYIKKKKHPALFGIKHIKKLDKIFVKTFIKYVLPTTANELFWALGMTAYSIIFSYMGTKIIAARNIVDTIESLVYVWVFSLGSGTGVLVGKELGASNFKNAQFYAKKMIKISMMLSVVFSGIMLLLMNPLLSLFNVSMQVKELAKINIILSCFFLFVRTFNAVNIVGILRPGGDTQFTFFVETANLWGIGVFSAFLSGLVFKFPFPIVYMSLILEETVKATIVFFRYKSKKWVNNIVDNLS